MAVRRARRRELLPCHGALYFPRRAKPPHLPELFQLGCHRLMRAAYRRWHRRL